jgi:hypothetical protein
MCNCNKASCPECSYNDPYAVFKQALDSGKRIQYRVSSDMPWRGGQGTIWAFNDPVENYRIHPDDVDKEPPKKPHIHAELIKAWADGAEIECFIGNEWRNLDTPKWLQNRKYRIKPTPKPDAVLYSCCQPLLNPFDHQYRDLRFGLEKQSGDNIQVIFDGETGELKDIKRIK